MCKVLSSSKGDIDGSQVGHVFYVKKHWPYCNVLWKDTIAVAQIFLRLDAKNC
jgi:hypothetical protein